MSRTPKKSRAPQPAPQRRRNRDQSYRQLFREPLAAADLIRNFAARDWAHELDMTTLQFLPTETVGPDPKNQTGDCAWHVRFKDGRSVVFLFEFRYSVDSDTALHMQRYTERALSVLRSNETLLDPDGSVPPVLPFVVRYGPPR